MFCLHQVSILKSHCTFPFNARKEKRLSRCISSKWRTSDVANRHWRFICTFLRLHNLVSMQLMLSWLVHSLPRHFYSFLLQGEVEMVMTELQLAQTGIQNLALLQHWQWPYFISKSDAQRELLLLPIVWQMMLTDPVCEHALRSYWTLDFQGSPRPKKLLKSKHVWR